MVRKLPIVRFAAIVSDSDFTNTFLIRLVNAGVILPGSTRMIGQITLNEPLVIDGDEWADLVSGIKNASVVDSHGFTNPMTGDVVKISNETKSKIRLNGKLTKRSSLIAVQESKGELVVAFRLTPFCDTIEFEGKNAACKETMNRLCKIVGGNLEFH